MRGNTVTLTFVMESESSLWNVVFPGFDDRAVLTATLSSADHGAVELLHRLATLLSRRNRVWWDVARTKDGLLLTRDVRLGNEEEIKRWTALIKSMREELEELVTP